MRSINIDIDQHPHYVGVVGQDGVIFDKDAYKGKNNTTCLSPALNIDLDSVIFASVIKGGMGESKSEYKMTLKDEDLAINTKWVVKEGNEVTVKYSGVTGNPDRIAYLITDKAYDADGCKIIKYSAAEIEGGEIGTSGKLKFTLPDDFQDSWKIYLLAENTNEDKYTDFASVPKLVKEKAPGEYSVTVECDGKGTAFADPDSGKEDETIKLSAEADEGWIFKEWKVVSGGVELEDPKEAKTRFVLKESDVVVKAVFEKPGEYTVTVEREGKGTAYADPESGKEGDTIKLSAEGDKGWKFKEWKVVSGEVELENPEEANTRFILKESNVVVKAVFEKEPNKDEDDDDYVEEPAGKPAVVNPDTVEGYFLVNGQPLPGVTLGKTKQGPAAQAVFKASTPAGWNEAFSFNISVNGKFEYTLKNGVLHIVIPKELRKPGRVFAVTGLDKNGKVTVFNDTDTDPNTLTANISFEGYAFELIYKD